MELSAGRASPESSSTEPQTPPRQEPESCAGAVEWTIRPWREHGAAAALSLLAALLLWMLVIWLLPGEGLVTALLGLAALAALAPGMAPMQCRVDASGVARRVLFAWDRRHWPEIRRARLGGAGLFVSPFARPSRLDRFRGLFLPVPRHDPRGDRLLEALRREVARHGL